MTQVVIENPVLNSAFIEPVRHFRFSSEGITDEVIESRRISTYFVPIARPKSKGKQLAFGTEWTEERIQENEFINRVRGRVSVWRKGGYVGITTATRRLLEYWTNPERERKLFFCQIEALESVIYLTEVAGKYGDSWIENELREFNRLANPDLFRIAFKMATGSGKTVVMAMLIAWHVLNKKANPQDTRFTDTFLIVTPGITIRDRLRVLLPNDPQNYYLQRDILTKEQLQEIGQAKIVITNFHAFKQRELVKAGKLTKDILAKGQASALTETPDQMVRRVCRELGTKKNIIVINDEAHHCYRRRNDGEDIKLTGDERKEAERREEEARVWISGLEAIKRKIGIKAVYDLSATPFFLRGSGYSEGTLFPWVISDFSLIDAIESGIVKVPRVPVSDDSMTGELPTYRNIWTLIRDHLPKKGRSSNDASDSGEPELPKELQGALHSLYGNYEKYYRKWEANVEGRSTGLTPPVFIVVCNNTNVSKLVYDWISGWEKKLPDDSTTIVPGNLPIFRNTDEYGNPLAVANSILIDSEQLDSGESISDDFKKAAALAIQEFKHDYCVRFPGRDAEKLTDEDILREVMNTVGKPGRLGENVKCVVSVSMLTEGWDANTVTHVMGVRAFGTQLLCEQVVGRALRRMSYVPDDNGMFSPEYAEVYGVPFSFIPCSGSAKDPKPGPQPVRVRALEERVACEITFPRLNGYRYEFPAEKLAVKFTEDSNMSLSTADIPTRTENAPIVGDISTHDLGALKEKRQQELVFHLAKVTLDKYFRDGHDSRYWFFPQLVDITRRWLNECLTLKDNAFPQMLFLSEMAHDASDRIYTAITASDSGPKRLKPILRPYDHIGSTRYVDFDTTRPVYVTDPAKCHVSHVVADTESWEQKMAQAIEEMDEVVCYVKNHGMNFFIPYALDGQSSNYMPDYIVRINDGKSDLLNLIIEVTGERKKDKVAKVSAARNLWIPAVNNHGGFGRWAFLEITDPWDAQRTIRSFIKDPGNNAELQ
ncbi:MAG: DEAD/DEAH box helicase family protein [Dehalogenimonas sp.]|uniref:DEAD/DEAH box helicase family protein n=1 Tax=Candidatus Dehalogenimonas loeffleri TaxID=3127115 RepID=A0ABZ2J9C2_9CHLR|nr:DEAD/DEAH box helicase family protein [Dehalogenimonas sp.]